LNFFFEILKVFFISLYTKMVVKKQFETSRQSMNWQGRELSLEIGKLAVQADASIRMQMGDNVMLYSTTMEKNPRE
jgi:hypothetical protein